jgi:hypothetical protein
VDNRSISFIMRFLFRQCGAGKCLIAIIRTQNPAEAIPWGFDSPSRHHLKSQYPLLNHRLAALVSALCFGCFLVGATLRYEFRYSAHPLSFEYLGSLVEDFISADYPYLRRIAECEADFVIGSLERNMLRRMSHRLPID